MRRRECQPHSCCGECDCACLIIYQRLRCEMNAGQPGGGSALRLLCREWLCNDNFEDGGICFISLSFFFLISFRSFNLLRSPAACLVLLFCCFIAIFYLTAFILCGCPFYFSLPIPSSCTPTPPPSNNPSDRRFPDMQGFDAASGLSEGFSDTAAKYTRGSTEPKRIFAIFMGATVRFSGLIFLS